MIADFLCLNPSTMAKLVAELDDANLSNLPQYRETINLPYLHVVVKEAIRLHAPVGVILERIVPEGGATICGHYFPAGTVVGCNPAVVHMNQGIYGRRYDVRRFVPERWLDASEEERAEMDRCWMAFGSGKRSCIGKNISMLEVLKLVPLLLRKYEVSSSPSRRVIPSVADGLAQFTLVDPTKDLQIWNTFFVHQKGLDMYIRTR
jgi:cytochrome P450